MEMLMMKDVSREKQNIFLEKLSFILVIISLLPDFRTKTIRTLFLFGDSRTKHLPICHRGES